MLGDGLLPFAISFALLFLLAFLQVSGLGDLLGDAEADGEFDLEMDAEVDGHADAFGALASIVGLGRMPFLMWLALLLFLFSGIGFTGQLTLDNLAGFMLSPYLAVPAALIAALPVTGLASRLLAPILPRDETTAVHRSALLGKRGAIDIGTARRGSPARALVRDIYGQSHNVMVEPHDDDASLEAGQQVLLVRREGELFYAISEEDRRLGTI